MEVRSRRLRETSPDRAKVCLRPRVKPIKKVQVVYYLSRNGHLEHPHYMEVTHLADQPLRLRDVMDRLTLLRGKGMPSLYSWSCKRSYKNGYVWNDLAENDTIYPTEGAEYVLKGSELVEGCSERLNKIQISRELNLQTRQKPLVPEKYSKYDDLRDYDEEEDPQQQEEYYEDEEKVSYTSSTTPHSRCSRGVSTDELDEAPAPAQAQTQAQKNPSNIINNSSNNKNNSSRRFEEGGVVDRVVVSESVAAQSSRNSVLLQLIACGSSAVAKAKSSPCVKPAPAMKRGIGSSGNNMRSGSDLGRGVLRKNAVKRVVEEDEDMINYISENPRFGNLQSQEKEYFSGSIVESMSDAAVSAVPILKRSNSYNEERNTKTGLVETVVEEEKRSDKAKMTGKCIPRKKSSASSKQEPKK